MSPSPANLIDHGPLWVQIKSVYGNRKCYPIGNAAKLIAKIAGVVTLSPRILADAKALGITIVADGSRDDAQWLCDEISKLSAPADEAIAEGAA